MSETPLNNSETQTFDSPKSKICPKQVCPILHL